MFIILKKIIVVVLIAAVFLTMSMMFAPLGVSAYEVDVEDVINDAQTVGLFGKPYRGLRYRFDVSMQGKYTPEAVAERTSSVVFTKDVTVTIYDKNDKLHYDGLCWFGYDAENGAVYFCDQTTWKWILKYDSDKRWKIRNGDTFVNAADSDGCFSMSTGGSMLPKIGAFFIDTYDYIWFINDFTEEVFLSDIYIGDKTAVDVNCPMVKDDYVTEPFVFDGYGLSYGEYDSYSIVEFRRSHPNSRPYIHFGYHFDMLFSNNGEIYETIRVSSLSMVIIPEAPKRINEHYTFLYWQDRAGQKYYPGDLVNARGLREYEFVAVWEYDAKFYLFILDNYSDPCHTTTLEIPLGEYVTLPTPTKDGFEFIGYYDDWPIEGEPVYYGGDKITLLKDTFLYEVWKEIPSIPFYFEDKVTGFKQTMCLSPDAENITFPILTEENPGYVFGYWTDGYSRFDAGSTRPIAALKSYTLYAVWQPITSSGGSSDDDRNFIAAFFFDTFDGLKEAVMPYLNDFTIPFLEITLADVISYLFWAALAFLVVYIVVKIARG